ncbi:hypothetical protein MPDQ_008206 [Monascus purpureus]|uniref:Uncharacterized protein n=1 Tax=Monascus purpureus TaxID=5098 RepID=A0A507QQD4_MONPU|nr:hypothetical protein MPDQ_008206 [Monascus purpureus]
MRACLCRGRLSYLGRSPFLSFLRAVSYRTRCSTGKVTSCRTNRQWSREFSANSARLDDALPSLDRAWLRERARGRLPRIAIPANTPGDPSAWIPLVEEYLPPSLRDGPEELESKDNIYQQAYSLAALLSQARLSEGVDVLGHLGFQLNRWPAVHALLSKLVDFSQALQQASIPRQPISSLDWGLSAGISLEQLSSGGASSDGTRWSSQVQLNSTTNPRIIRNSLEELSNRPFADELSRRLMGEVWSNLGSIVLFAADLPPNESKLAMSCVFQILARLHHSGSISENVYRDSHMDSEQAGFRPPGLYLLSTHIMSILSDAAWRVHEAEVAAKAAAAGEDSPFLPFKFGFRELGPEVWFELILWCCVDHAHYMEGAWLLEKMKAREGTLAWHLKSWKPLLEYPELVRKTKIDSEEFWHDLDSPTPTRSSRKRNPVFHGLGERTISTEVVESLLGGLVDNAYLGFGHHGLPLSKIRQYISRFMPMIAPGGDGELQPTTKAFNWLTVRILESGGLNAELDPNALEQVLRLSPHVVPPWDESCPTAEEALDELEKSRLYDETAAMAGLIEYNIRFYAARQRTGSALKTCAWLQEVVDSSKLQHIHNFLEHVSQLDCSDLGFFDGSFLTPHQISYESSIPQMSNVTFARLLDLAATAGAFTFGKWLLHSDDMDGPPIPRSAYGDQALAPSILRFAAASKDRVLCDQVVQSLSSPISLNTLRSLANVRIALGEWDRVVQILEYIRDHRLKSWGHSNVAALAAAILEADSATIDIENGRKNKKAALDILLRLFNGDFNDKYDRSERSFQQKTLYSFRRLFMSIPGPLRELAQKATLCLTRASISPHQVPIIPTAAFHPFLTALVHTHGSTAGKNLWEQWCVDPPFPSDQRLREGGIPRLYFQRERDRERGDPHFDTAWFQHTRQKAIIPNLDTVRIIAQAALREYNAGLKKKVDAEAVLDFCVERFRHLGLPDDDINWELRGYLER